MNSKKLAPSFFLEDKVAFITGANSGMGLAIASLFAASGAKLALFDRDPKIHETAKGLDQPTVVLTELGAIAWGGAAGEALKKEIPIGRFAEPGEVAAAVAFLASDSANMITGENLLIDGGYTIY